MEETSNSESNTTAVPAKPRRHYNRRNSNSPQLQPQMPNPAIQAMESELVPLLQQRTNANLNVTQATAAANRANQDLQQTRDYLAQIESEVNYRLQVIAQLKGVPFTPQFQQSAPLNQGGSPYPPRFGDYPQPSPTYQPIMPFPPGPAPMGVSSFPAANRGLYPDANPPSLNLVRDPEEIANASSALDFQTPELRAQFEGRQR